MVFEKNPILEWLILLSRKASSFFFSLGNLIRLVCQRLLRTLESSSDANQNRLRLFCQFCKSLSVPGSWQKVSKRLIVTAKNKTFQRLSLVLGANFVKASLKWISFLIRNKRRKVGKATRNKQKRARKKGAKSNFIFNYEAQSWRDEAKKELQPCTFLINYSRMW